MDWILQQAGGGPAASFGVPEIDIKPTLATLTPGFAATVGMQAVASCAKAGLKTEQAKLDCLAKSTSASLLSR